MNKFILVFLLFCSSIFAAAQRRVNVEISFNDCRADEGSPITSPDDVIRFYKLPEDKLIRTIKPYKYNEHPFLLKKMPVADYRVTFRNQYQQMLTKKISVTGNDMATIELCTDELAGYPQNTLAKFKDNDSLVLNYRSQGCFHSWENKLVIEKKGASFVARLYKKPAYSWIKKGENFSEYHNESADTVTLSAAQLTAFQRFENELNFAADGGCTTVSWYEIKSPYLNAKATDGSCRWNGFVILVRSFFGSETYLE